MNDKKLLDRNKQNRKKWKKRKKLSEVSEGRREARWEGVGV